MNYLHSKLTQKNPPKITNATLGVNTSFFKPNSLYATADISLSTIVNLTCCTCCFSQSANTADCQRVKYSILALVCIAAALMLPLLHSQVYLMRLQSAISQRESAS
ncbi:hypothetical protein MiSe_08890 [Microseira wollei NIES-4236]|uniref:Uncharacterized protein n=1 Tax=Microseira wollei NIES-4236 TaxID=2530354 RepID=A0AAV3X4K9_9CYAN|nr:hypothetical protein MiSe_08890 [Microseira wollei NIES-4236]